MANFFIDRPVFAWVIAIVIMMAGILSLNQLPVQQYPTIAPPTISVGAYYPGASSKTLEDSVTQVIEQSMTGLDNLLYMSSQSDSSGNATVSLTFASGTDSDIAQVQVQNKLKVAEALLPSAVKQQGVNVTKSSSAFLMVIGLVSGDGKMDRADLSDYAYSTLREPLSRVSGVGNVRVFGSQYAMRIWMNPEKLTAFGLTPVDVVNAVSSQNTQVSAGQLGGLPAVGKQQLNATIIAQTRFESTQEFANTLLKVNQDGSQVRLKDVARIERGAEIYGLDGNYNGRPASGIAIQLATGANALDTAKLVKAKLAEMKPFFPAGLEIVYPFDTTPFVQISIDEVVHTLIEAVGLVFLVMYLFLGNLRATLIPTIAVPVVLLGTFGVLAAFGFSINTLSMFGMVLAIGLLVDDAIVVVENVERVMEEDKLSPREATRKSMGQIISALVGIALVLSAVFIPMAFFGGSTGAIYRQFSITIVSAMILSVVVAVVLAPALCATILKQPTHSEKERKGFFGWFNRLFGRATGHYERGVSAVIKRPVRLMVIYLVLLLGLGFMYQRLPTSFLPTEDQGVIMTLVQLPAGATQERTLGVLEEVSKYFQKQDDVDSVFTVAGFSFAGQGQNMGMAFVKLKDWDERPLPSQSSSVMVGKAFAALSQIRDASIFPINLPPIPELGTAAGFDVMLQDYGNQGHEKLMAARNQLLGMAAQDARLTAVRPNGMEDVAVFRIDIDEEKLSALGLNINEVNTTLSAAWGSAYVNDFLDEGRVKKVFVQGDAPFRMKPENLDQWHVRNAAGEMVPFSAFASTHWDYGSPRLERFNGLPSMNLQGQAAPGLSTGDAMNAIEELVAKLPDGFGLSWSGMSFQEKASGAQTMLLYGISLMVVFLFLAALYESWSVPFAVMMVVPLGILGALALTMVRGFSNDVYFQVGLLTTIGLSTKNAILIVEFAKTLVGEGMGVVEATLRAARMRLRPIIMTSLAFMFGVLPLAVSTGAGAASRQAIGTAVVGGMLSATFLAIFFVPLFYVLVMRLSQRKPDKTNNVENPS
jgi:multidrug efflux pump